MNETTFDTLKGRTLVSVTGGVGDDRMFFECEDGASFQLFHEQDCCESVSIQDIAGDVADLIGSPLLTAEESVSDRPGEITESADDSETWTFYRLSTIKGSVVVRWLGSSNGYYSESVSFSRA